MNLTEITTNLQVAVERYSNLPLDDVLELSEILRTLDVNLSRMVHIRDEYKQKYESYRHNSKAKSESAKKSEAEFKTPELDLVRKILLHYSEVQRSIRTQISLRKKHD